LSETLGSPSDRLLPLLGDLGTTSLIAA